MHTGLDINVSLFPNHRSEFTHSPEVSLCPFPLLTYNLSLSQLCSLLSLNGSSVFLQNVGTLLPDCMVPWSWRPQCICWWKCSRLYQYPFRDSGKSYPVSKITAKNKQISGIVMLICGWGSSLWMSKYWRLCENSEKMLSGLEFLLTWVLKLDGQPGRNWQQPSCIFLHGPSCFVQKCPPFSMIIMYFNWSRSYHYHQLESSLIYKISHPENSLKIYYRCFFIITEQGHNIYCKLLCNTMKVFGYACHK